MSSCFCNDFASYKQKLVARDHQAVDSASAPCLSVTQSLLALPSWPPMIVLTQVRIEPISATVHLCDVW